MSSGAGRRKGASRSRRRASRAATDLAAIAMAAPPLGTSFARPSFPAIGAEVLVDPSELTAFRTGPADLGASPASARLDGSAPDVAPGLALVNPTDQLRFAWLDGAPVAWAASGGRLVLPALLRGRYGFAWRTFLGEAYDAPITITLPAAMVASHGDAGAP